MGLLTGLGSLALGGIGSALGANFGAPLLQQYLGRENFKDQTAAAHGLMNANQAFALMLSSTAHQREVEDLRKAGLNPLLSALGSGASAPVVGTSSAGTHTMPNVNFDYSAKRFSQEYKNQLRIQEEQINSHKAQQKLYGAQAFLAQAQSVRQNAEAARIMEHISEGVGTPKQTQNVIYNVIKNAAANISSAAKGIHQLGIENTDAYFSKQKVREMEIKLAKQEERIANEKKSNNEKEQKNVHTESK